MTASFPRRKLHEAELKRLAELEEERRHRLGQGKDVSDLELIIADRSLDTGGDVKTLALEGQPLLTQNGEVAEGAIVPHDQKVEEVNEDPARPVWTSNNVTHRMLATQVKAFHEWFRPHYNPVENHMVWPPLSGEDWGRLVEDDSRLLRYLGDWLRRIQPVGPKLGHDLRGTHSTASDRERPRIEGRLNFDVTQATGKNLNTEKRSAGFGEILFW